MFVGEADQPLPETDSRSYRSFANLDDETTALIIDVFGRNRVTEHFQVAESVYREAGASAEFTVYEVVGHRITREITEDLRTFHRRNLDTSDDAGSVGAVSSDGGPSEGAAADENEAVIEETPGFGFGAAVGGSAGTNFLLGRRFESDE